VGAEAKGSSPTRPAPRRDVLAKTTVADVIERERRDAGAAHVLHLAAEPAAAPGTTAGAAMRLRQRSVHGERAPVKPAEWSAWPPTYARYVPPATIIRLRE
jgi:hypothetical protein